MLLDIRRIRVKLSVYAEIFGRTFYWCVIKLFHYDNIAKSLCAELADVNRYVSIKDICVGNRS